LLAALLRRIAPEVDLADIDPSESLTEAAELDSMDFLNLVTALHEQTGIEVPERDYPAVSTVDGFVAYVTSHVTSHVGTGHDGGGDT
jgi:acyl carrier protein